MTYLKLAAVAALLTPFAACAQSSEPAPVAPSLTVSPQAAGASVVVDVASIPADGWLVIHAMQDGKPVAPASIGHAPLKAGENTSVTVAIDPPAQPGDVVIAMLHNDDGEIGVYQFGPGSVDYDKPVVADGKPVVQPIPLN